MKKVLVSLALLSAIVAPVFADELKVNVGVESGQAVTKVLGADIYATVDNQLVEISIAPDRLPFKANLKTGALRLKGFWATQAQFEGK